ncbi:MAG: hypothetical protein ABR568_09365 [Pyrinomonadaceae bacterium]
MRNGQKIKPRPVKEIKSPSRRMCLAVLVAVCSYVSGCNQQRQSQPAVEAPPIAQPVQAAEPVQLPKLTPPKLIEVQAAVKRVFKEAAVIDTSLSPNFISGDFNGDLSQDIVVVLRVAPGKLADMNEEFPAWILRDPFVSNRPGMQRLRVEENDVLLAVIHGYGANDWRDPQATQTYLLKNAVGSRLEVHVGKEFVTANTGKKIPRLNGDLIGEVLRGSAGYLYYAGESYAWYDPKTFKGEPERRFVHSRRART